MEFSLAVLNPGGRDKMKIFAHGAGLPADPGHPPVNYHGYAACCGGGFYQRIGEVPESVGNVLVLLRKNGLGEALDAVRKLRKRGKRVLISWKESGLPQVAGALEKPGLAARFRTLCEEADGFVSSTTDLVPLYDAAGCRQGGFVPTPYPLEDPAWDFSISIPQRQGVFIGTREFGVPSRNHFLAVSAISKLGRPATVINADGWRGVRLLRSIFPDARVVPGQLPYADYLRLMARHRVVFQLDRSAVPGQVAGDALLCRLPCVGGDGAIDRLTFPDLSGASLSVGSAIQAAERLLGDSDYYAATLDRARDRALRWISFSRVKEQLLAAFER
ncbi:MAG TPA: hypothetical protein VFI76_03485 [Terrimicrobiaceae bacterium]|nr:hypothetical protein [Terrimicrobiaceae bacterium]